MHPLYSPNLSLRPVARPGILSRALAVLILASTALAGPRDAAWKQVEDAATKGLPKTAIERLEPIIAGAMADKSYAEAVKAIARKIALEGEIQGGKPEEMIIRLQAELEKAPATVKPVMEALLAHQYWQYFQQNRWRFHQRTQTTTPPGSDFQSWDLARILAEIDKHFTAALADDAALKATPIADWDVLIAKGSVPDSYRPTLFDFLAYDALQFYQAGEQGAVVAEDAFELDAAGPIFGEVAAFRQWRPESPAGDSPTLKAIRLYQALLEFHRNDADRSAFLDADLARLEFGDNSAVGEGKDDRYKAALQRFIDATSAHEISSRTLAALAAQFYEEGEFARAHELARRGDAAFPASAGATMCFNLLQKIEARSARLDTERVWNAPWPTLNVTYRNVTKVYFRAVSVDFARDLEQRRWGGRNNSDTLDSLLAEKPTLAWDAALPATADFKERTERLPTPTSLTPGFYFIVASHEPTFRELGSQVSYTAVWVSDLVMVTRTRADGLPQGGLVLKANSGEPVAGATVRLWRLTRNGWYEPTTPTKTDDNGRFHLPAGEAQLVALAESNGHAVSSDGPVYVRSNDEDERAGTRTVFFTDRAIYRPGQTIHYKGVAIHYDQGAGQYSAVADELIDVGFADANDNEIARATHRTNAYGSFSGTFTAPGGRVTGRMVIATLDESGGTTISVEEYKRPKFQVDLPAPAEASRLDAPVVLTGKATSYTGAAIGGATVKWRVEREVQLPSWCWWWRPPAAQAIAHGAAVTAADGTFAIQFPAAPDRSVSAKNEPIFIFTIHADVTDTTGETRSADRLVRIGYAALQASLEADAWQTPDAPVAFKVATRSLDGDPQPAAGTLTVHALKQPDTVARGLAERVRRWWNAGTAEPAVDPTNPDSWEPGEVVAHQDFKTDATGGSKIALPLKAGIYRASLETRDRFGKTVTARQTLQVVDPRGQHYAVKLPNLLASPRWTIEPGEKFVALWGTGYPTGRAFVELECNGRSLRSYWTGSDRTQERIELPVTEKMRGGFTVRTTYVRENRAYIEERVVDVPWSNKELTVKWERFRSKLAPGQKETWTAIVTGPDANGAAAEMVAALYDASLDQYLAFNWPRMSGVFRTENPRCFSEFGNSELGFQAVRGWPSLSTHDPGWSYREWTLAFIDSEEVVKLSPFEVSSSVDQGYMAAASLAGTRVETQLMDRGSATSVVTKQFLANSAPSTNTEAGGVPEPAAAGPKPDLSKVVARRNLNETAFFFPQLTSGDNGIVRISFTMPEALTEWRFLGFAHDAQLRVGFLAGRAVTAKDLMVEPNPPRFVREGDVIEFTVKVSNQSDQPQSGTVRLTFADAATQKPVDDALANRVPEQAFTVPARQSRSYSWRIAVPDGLGFLTYKAVAATAQLSDGEEGNLPVLSRRILVTESLPLPIRGRSTKEFRFEKLLASGASDTLRSQSLTVQMTSQPAWYAVMALPYLMEYPYECSEQVFNRLYANALARHIANSDPKIRRVFDLWRNTPALDSPLQKNQDLKSVALEETPWRLQAMAESQSRRNVGLLFDANRLDDEAARTLKTLAERQLGDGLWSWFPGGPPSEYISLYIVTGFGRLRHLGVEVDIAPAVKALDTLDAWMDDRYRRILESPSPDNHVPGHLEAIFLYGRSFFLKDHPVAPSHQAAVDFFLRQARRHWVETDCRQCEADLAIALQRFGDAETPLAIMKSLKEHSVSDEELGMFWRDEESSWWWYRAPIETQAMMIEAFAEVGHDTESVEACQVWLLKQKQTQDWKTTKATADAIYALLLRGSNLLASDALVEVSLAGGRIQPAKVEAGTGFYEQKFTGGEIKPAMGQITVRKVDDGVSWGSVHWQYLEDIAKVTPHQGTPLKLTKALFVKETTARGPVLKPVTGPVAVGDELVVRIELRVDRDLEYVHLKDQRGSGTEPVNVLSRYKQQDGLAYYESTRDTATHFFIDYLPKGTYVFEYSARVQLRGAYQTGIAEIQCMYAPEFNSHSESIALEVK